MGHFPKQFDLFIILRKFSTEIHQNYTCANYADLSTELILFVKNISRAASHCNIIKNRKQTYFNKSGKVKFIIIRPSLIISFVRVFVCLFICAFVLCSRTVCITLALWLFCWHINNKELNWTELNCYHFFCGAICRLGLRSPHVCGF